MSVPVPPNEAKRLARLRALLVLDTESEPLFDALTRAAAAATGVPLALISLIDEQRQWFKSNIGLQANETPRDQAFCGYTILDDALLEVPDARKDARFVDNPLVTGAPGIRHYVGAPIILDGDLRVGSLCVIGYQPGALSVSQKSTMQALADAAAQAFDLRLLALQRQQDLQLQADRARELAHALHISEAFLERTASVAGVGGWEVELASKRIIWSDQTCRIHGLLPGYQPSLEEALDFYAPDARPVMLAAITKGMSDGAGWDLELPLITATGERIWVRTVGTVNFSDEGTPERLLGAFQDVTVRHRVVQALEGSERRFRKLFEYSLGLICTHDHEGVLLSLNPAAARLLGYSVGDLLGRSLTEFMRPERHAGFKQYLLRIMRNDSDDGVLELFARDGSRLIWMYRNVIDDNEDSGGDPYVLCNAQDITDRFEQEQRLREQSLRDPLTGCFNRRYLEQLQHASDAHPWGCIVVDLDHFKQVNDTFGHQRGDEVLVAMAGFLSTYIRPQDAVVRMGGDEFLVLLKDAGGEITDRVVARIDEHRGDAPIAFSLGVSQFGDERSLDEGLAAADQALYRSRAGRDQR